MVKGYSRIQIALHWLVGLLIVTNLLLGEDMSHVWREFTQNGSATMTTGAWAHILLGVSVLMLVLWRLALRLTRGAPAAPEGGSALMTLAGSAAHLGLYALMIALPVTGLLAWYGGVTWLAGLHGELLKSLLWALIALHVGAALYHQFVLKDGLLARMRKPQD